MSMRPEQENFDQLRRLLAIKRHEQPPPGYFDRFPGEVMARLQAGEHRIADDPLESYFIEAPWLQRIWAALDSNPMLAGAFGVLVCGLLISGVIYSESVSSRPGTLPTLPGAELTEVTQTSDNGGLLTPGRVEFPTNGVLTTPSLFDELREGSKPGQIMQVTLPVPNH
jgi:hypothetical protein